LLLLFPPLLWFLLIRRRLGTKLTAIYTGGSFWQRFAHRFHAFQTFWVACIFAVLTALPDILVAIAPLDLSPFLPQPWAAYTGPAATIMITILRALDTKPGEES
jgi:hypothetical protein